MLKQKFKIRKIWPLSGRFKNPWSMGVVPDIRTPRQGGPKIRFWIFFSPKSCGNKKDTHLQKIFSKTLKNRPEYHFSQTSPLIRKSSRKVFQECLSGKSVHILKVDLMMISIRQNACCFSYCSTIQLQGIWTHWNLILMMWKFYLAPILQNYTHTTLMIEFMHL